VILTRRIDSVTHPVIEFLQRFEPQSSDGIVVRLKLAVPLALGGLVLLVTLPLWMAWLAFLLRFRPKLNQRTTQEHLAPPPNAEFLFFLFLDHANCDALVGDLEERYRLIHQKFGQWRADFWYWTQALRSVGPILSAGAKKIAMKPFIGLIGWAVMKGLWGDATCSAALVKLWKRVLS
jgi:hypothetical protein